MLHSLVPNLPSVSPYCVPPTLLSLAHAQLQMFDTDM